MSDKEFVRVEWLALATVVDLMHEAGLDNSYFVSKSSVLGDEGEAIMLARLGRDLYGSSGDFVKSEALSAEDFGLEQDIGKLTGLLLEDEVRDDGRYFLKRGYAFEISQRGDEAIYINIFVSFAKRTEQDEWELVHESLIDHRNIGNARWVIHRTDQKRNKD